MLRSCSGPALVALSLVFTVILGCSDERRGAAPADGTDVNRTAGGRVDASVVPPTDGSLDLDGSVDGHDGGRDAGAAPWVPPPPARSEPASCTGAPTSCSLRPLAQCENGAGCDRVGTCAGSPKRCVNQIYDSLCYDIDGCYWSGGRNGYCGGTPRECNSYNGSLSCEGQLGCDWSEECKGTPTACSLLSSSSCANQPGCSLQCSAGLSLCNGRCADVLDDELNCGACGFECGPRSNCQNGSCSCGAPYTACRGQCVNTNDDEQHCGACGHACKNGFTCQAGECVDVDECASLSPCRDGRVCSNTPGGYVCGSCPAGFITSGTTNCLDINECATNNGGCDSHASCTNETGSFRCACGAGYQGDGKKCTDVDECEKKTHACDFRRTCTNTEGGYTCGPCPSGYVDSYDNNTFSCRDIDECAGSAFACDRLTTCTNLDGTYACSDCPTGYTGTGATGCMDIDECATNNGGCSPLRTCQNNPGGRTCANCPSGYDNDGLTGCKDIDECSRYSNGGCDALRTCTNTIGGRTCGACPKGYDTPDAVHCVDIDECASGNGGCDPLTLCQNFGGGSSCSFCPSGYDGTGETGCYDIDECQFQQSMCDPLVTCENIPGSVRCGPCPTGYASDGWACRPQITAIRVTHHASLDPVLTPEVYDHDLQWEPSEGPMKIAFEVAQGVSIFVDEQPRASGEFVDVNATLERKTISVRLVSSKNNVVSTYRFSSHLGCGARLVASVVPLPNGTWYARFGSQIAASSQWVFIGANPASPSGQAVAFYPTNEPNKLNFLYPEYEPIGGGNTVVALGKDVAFAAFPDTPATYQAYDSRGQVRVFDTNATSIFEWQRLRYGADEYSYGQAIAASEDRLAVATSRFDNTEISVMRRVNKVYTEQGRIRGITRFMPTMAWFADQLAVAQMDGKVSLYTEQGGTWAKTSEINAPDASGGSTFGESMTYDQPSNLLLIGDGRTFDSSYGLGGYRGRVYAYHRSGSDWVKDQPLPTPSEVIEASSFGASTAIGPKWIAVGAPSDATQNEVGRVYLYWRSSNGPAFCGSLLGSGMGGDLYGKAIAAAGSSTLVVGAPGDRNADGQIFQYSVGAWNLVP